MRSQLWPANSPYNQTRIFSRWKDVGWHQGAPITAPSIVARPTTLSDLVQAIQNAGDGSVVFPQGIIPFNQRIQVTRPHRWLLAHEQGTTLQITQSLYDLFGLGPHGKVNLGIGYGYAWGGGHIEFGLDPDTLLDDCGVIGLKWSYPDNLVYEGHWKERGYNPLYAFNVKNFVLKDLTVRNMDSGPIILSLLGPNEDPVEHSGITVENVTVDCGTRQHPNIPSGHYGLTVNVGDVLVKDFHVLHANHYHDFHFAQSYGVITHSAGYNLNFDPHNSGGNRWLFDNVNLGQGSRIWQNGGNVRLIPDAGPYNCFWNVRKSDGSRVSTVPTGWSPPLDWFVHYDANGQHVKDRGLMTFVGHTLASTGDTYTETIVPSTLEPQSLYAALRGTPLPPPHFTIGQTVKTLSQVNVRSTPLRPSDNSNLLGTQPQNVTAVVLEGPQIGSNITWWKLDFGTGVDGWVGQDGLGTL